MQDQEHSSIAFFESYVDSFAGLTPEQQNNFTIKKEHSLRVAANAHQLANYLELDDEDKKVAFTAAVFHDIGRFKQLVDFNTFNDEVSADHAEYAVEIVKEKGILKNWNEELRHLVFAAIQLHNKLSLPKRLNERELLHAKLLRDADKLDILKVLTDYYTDRNKPANHTLTWELPTATKVSPQVAKEVLAGKLVSKSEVKSELDVKIMQLSWVYDINFKPSFELIFRNRFLEKIYSTMPKNDRIIEIYRKVKVFAENKLMR
ncbi:MAG: HD domain-containing protein [Bacteroidota bacterium]